MDIKVVLHQPNGCQNTFTIFTSTSVDAYNQLHWPKWMQEETFMVGLTDAKIVKPM
jgi:hypothetical protein